MKTFLFALLPISAFAAHQLVSDDTGTQGAGKWQYELNTDRATDQTASSKADNDQFNTTLTYGLDDASDLALNLPYTRIRQDGAAAREGGGDASLVLKHRFYDKDGLSFAIKPQLNLPMGDKDKGLGNGLAGAALDGLLSVAVGDATILANGGLTWNRNAIGARNALWNLSVAGVYAASDKVSLALDSGVYRNVADGCNPAFALVGVIWSPSKALDLDVGYKRGLNHAEIRHGVGFGLTLHR